MLTKLIITLTILVSLTNCAGTKSTSQAIDPTSSQFQQHQNYNSSSSEHNSSRSSHSSSKSSFGNSRSGLENYRNQSIKFQ